MCRLAQASRRIDARRHAAWVERADLATELARVVVAAIGAGIPTREGVNPLLEMAGAIDFAGTRSAAPAGRPISDMTEDEIVAGLAPGGLQALLSIFRGA